MARWSDIIDEVSLRQIPIELIEAVKFITRDGQDVSIKISELVNLDSDNIGEVLEEAIESRKDKLKAVEFAVNFDKLEKHIVDAIVKLFEPQ